MQTHVRQRGGGGGVCYWIIVFLVIIIVSPCPWWQRQEDRDTDAEELINGGGKFCGRFTALLAQLTLPPTHSNQVATYHEESFFLWEEKNADKTYIVTQFTSFEQSEVALCAR